jgi:hypothetical protein
VDARREPRFDIYGPIKVTVLSQPTRELDCLLLDISATGLKLIAPESLSVDDIIALEAEDHLAIADVRYSQPRGDRFTIGGERIHLLHKVSLPKDETKIEAIRFLIDDYRNRLRDGIVTPRPDANEAEIARLDHQLLAGSGQPKSTDAPAEKQSMVQPLPGFGQYATHDQLLEAAAAWVVEQWDKVPAEPHEEPADRSEIIDRLRVDLAERLRAQAPSPPPAVVSALVKPLEAVWNKVPRFTARSWRIPAGVAATALLGWALSALFWSPAASKAAGHLSTSIASLISGKQTAPPTTPVASPRHAQIKAVEATWVIATSDGKRLFSKKLAKNDVREIEFSDKALLNIGNARGIEISLDGKPIGPLGRRGQTRVVELSANGFRFLPVK